MKPYNILSFNKLLYPPPPSISDTRGFTLVEISIVIVIIGLLVGGVLIGRDLIETAQLRKGVSKIESLKSATRAFKLKYECLPGDCTYASRLFTGSAAQNGNGNGLVDAAWSNSGIEWDRYWHQLSQAGLFTITSCSQITHPYCQQPFMEGARGTVTGAASPDCWPWGDSNRCFTNHKNRLLLFGSGDWGDNPLAFTPARAFYFDTKLDDGAPLTGNLVARNNIFFGAGDNSMFPPVIGASGNVCVLNTTTPASYNVRNSTQRCNLEILNIGF